LRHFDITFLSLMPLIAPMLDVAAFTLPIAPCAITATLMLPRHAADICISLATLLMPFHTVYSLPLPLRFRS